MSPRDVIMSKPIIMYQRSCFTPDGMSIIMHIPSATPSRPLVLAIGETRKRMFSGNRCEL